MVRRLSMCVSPFVVQRRNYRFCNIIGVPFQRRKDEEKTENKINIEKRRQKYSGVQMKWKIRCRSHLRELVNDFAMRQRSAEFTSIAATVRVRVLSQRARDF